MDVDYKKLASLLQDNQLDLAYKITKEQLAQLPSTGFHLTLEIDWLQLAEHVSTYVEKFYKSAKRAIKSVEAIYCEMNAFTINYDNWVVQFFGFSKFAGTEDFDWLADYDYTQDNALLFSGLEKIQMVFKDYIENEKWNDEKLVKARELSEYIIILGVQLLFREASNIAKSKRLKWPSIPVFVNANDYDDLIFNVTSARPAVHNMGSGNMGASE